MHARQKPLNYRAQSPQRGQFLGRATNAEVFGCVPAKELTHGRLYQTLSFRETRPNQQLGEIQLPPKPSCAQLLPMSMGTLPAAACAMPWQGPCDASPSEFALHVKPAHPSSRLRCIRRLVCNGADPGKFAVRVSSEDCVEHGWALRKLGSSDCGLQLWHQPPTRPVAYF